MSKAVEPSQWLSLVASFALVLVLLLGTLWVLRRIGAAGLRSQAGRRLVVVESLWLGNRQRVVLLRVDDREVLLGVSAQGISRLDAPAGGSDRAAERTGSDSMTPSANAGDAASGQVGAAARVPPSPEVRNRFVDAMRSMTGRASEGERR